MDEWFEASHAFHLAMIRLAGSKALVQAYERFTVPGVMTRALGSEPGPIEDIADDHVRIVEAYERGDLGAAVEAIRSDYRRAVDLHLARLRSAGGPLRPRRDRPDRRPNQ